MYTKLASTAIMAGILSAGVMAGNGSHLIGFQTFDPKSTTNNNGGILDSTADTNSSWDGTPNGGISLSGHYLTAQIGDDASPAGRQGRGVNVNSEFLNGQNFGGADILDTSGNPTQNAEGILNWPLAGGFPAARIGPFTSPNNGMGSSWKFIRDSIAEPVQLTGDISLTNHSDYYFRLEFIHFDARAGNVNAPHDLQLIYLEGGANPDYELRRGSDDTEVADATAIYDTENANLPDFADGGADNIQISRGVGAALNGAVYIAPGKTAAFRFLWSNQLANFAESQLDNIAFEGTFFETADLLLEVDPVNPVGAENIPVLPFMFHLALAGSLCVISAGLITTRRLAR